jgi:hypothetical protein
MYKLTESEWIWRDGEFVPWKDATLHVLAHAVQFGSAVFEGVRCYATPRARPCSGCGSTSSGCTTRARSTAWR